MGLTAQRFEALLPRRCLSLKRCASFMESAAPRKPEDEGRKPCPELLNLRSESRAPSKAPCILNPKGLRFRVQGFTPNPRPKTSTRSLKTKIFSPELFNRAPENQPLNPHLHPAPRTINPKPSLYPQPPNPENPFQHLKPSAEESRSSSRQKNGQTV